MAQFTLKGFTTQDVADFAYSKGYQDEIDGEANPISKGQHCKNYFRMLVKNDIMDYREKVAKLALPEVAEPEITVD